MTLMGRLRGRVARLRMTLARDLSRGPNDSVLVAGVGRSGTTWLTDLLNHGSSFRVIFEPFVPSRVPDAAPLGYLRYIPREAQPPTDMQEAARKIVSGHLPLNQWTGRENQRWIARRRLIKTIRANLMLGWLVNTFRGLRTVLLLRHPIAVAHSWRQLGWGTELDGDREDVEILLAQPDLVSRYLEPHLDALASSEPWGRLIYEWCVLNLVPLAECRPGEIHLAFYETLCVEPHDELERIANFLDVSLGESHRSRITLPSSQSTPRSAINTGADRIGGWRASVTPAEIDRAMEILARFRLDEIYDAGLMPDPDAARRLLARDPEAG